MSNASYQELLKARQEGSEALGKGVSDCPYAKTGLQDMGQRDHQLADAWCAGLIEAEAMERDADEEPPLAVTITLSAELAMHRDVAAEAARRVLPDFASVAVVARRESDEREGMQNAQFDIRDNVDIFDAKLSESLRAAVVERLRLAMLDGWLASSPAPLAYPWGVAVTARGAATQWWRIACPRCGSGTLGYTTREPREGDAHEDAWTASSFLLHGDKSLTSDGDIVSCSDCRAGPFGVSDIGTHNIERLGAASCCHLTIALEAGRKASSRTGKPRT